MVASFPTRTLPPSRATMMKSWRTTFVSYSYFAPALEKKQKKQSKRSHLLASPEYPDCETWSTVSPLEPVLSQWRSGHSMFIRNSVLFLVGGFDGNFYGGMTSFPIVLMPWQESCPAQYCVQYHTCSTCAAQPLCSWCPSVATCTVSQAFQSLGVLSNFNCSSYEDSCFSPSGLLPPVPPPFYALSLTLKCFMSSLIGCASADFSCDSCISAGYNCSWCSVGEEGIQDICIPANETNFLVCRSGWSDDTCQFQTPDLFTTCEICTSNSYVWCAYTNACQYSYVSCPTLSYFRSETCPVECAELTEASLCYQPHTCMWCDSTSSCIEGDTYLTTFAFGECLTWSICKPQLIQDRKRRKRKLK